VSALVILLISLLCYKFITIKDIKFLKYSGNLLKNGILITIRPRSYFELHVVYCNSYRNLLTGNKINTIIAKRLIIFICPARHKHGWIYVFFLVDMLFIILSAYSSDVYWKMDKHAVILKNRCKILRFLRRKYRVRKSLCRYTFYVYVYMYQHHTAVHIHGICLDLKA
jgi:hypothetical protein